MVEWWPRQRGAAVGTYAAVRYGGAALGPLGGGWLLDRFPLWTPFAAVAMLLLMATLVALRLVREPGAER
jgi:MFS family permease